ncbi:MULTISPECIES: NACHT domain-containing protein [unclassified Kitasatospora]|uniref:NACHT domain-containing protein n=1 Tax=unclassified Kitasatospora TaxID=2633591 RepID=UPI001F1FF9B1|nr:MULTISPECIES: NACHT domain-containing protein [unclassified Kitasatospora]
MSRMRRVRREARRRVAPTQKWRRRWTPGTYVWLLSIVGTVLFLSWIGLAVYVIVDGRPGIVERTCRTTGTSCSTVISFSTPFLALALSTLVFLVVRRWKIVRPVRRTAKRAPRELVPTAGSIIEEVVGRQELCTVIAQALRDRRSRRPYILVGSVGSGKTAVLVQLTQLLAEKGAVPVPIHLRAADLDRDDFNFGELAKRRFCDEVDPGVISRAQAERVWRQICMDDKAVVIADGLEEAFIEGDQQRNRDSVIRRAIKRAEKQKLPLVIASRPHAALEGTQAAVIDLEPLSEEAALVYLEQNDPGVDGRRLDWIVETAAVTESPLYLQIARQLRKHQLLEHFENTKEWDQIETRDSDRSGIRRSLLASWLKAIVEGHLRAQFDLTEQERRRTVSVISALACIGLLNDRLEVRFDELIDRASSVACPRILAELRERIPDLPNDDEQGCWSTRLSRYAAQGEQLGLVEAHSSKVRFPHSILQAFLGSHFLDAVQGSCTGDLEKALAEPGRELLIALIMRSRSRRATTPQRATVRLLLDKAEERQDDKALDLFAAALEIDTGRAGDSLHAEAADRILQRWPEITAGDRRTRDEAKLRLVHRFGEALRLLDRSRKHDPDAWEAPAYGELMRISWIEPSYPIRLAIAQEIGAGGDTAFDELRKLFPWPTERDDPEAGQYDPWEQYEKAIADQQYAENTEREKRILRPDEAASARRAETARSEIWRQFVTRAWLVPMIVGSVGSDRRSQARERLDLWLRHLMPNPATGRADLPISLEIALAQGFKSAANRRRRHPATSSEAREYLIERAEHMLAHARYWYSQLTLIHALCLWELPDSTNEGPDGGDGGDPLQAVERWLTMAGSEQAPADRPADELTVEGLRRLHPFVAEAGDLAALALETRHPERFIWIDEKGATVNIGSSPADPTLYRKHNLWIPPSVGWSTLHPRAQQLLADVLLLLNLTERDGLLVDDRLHRTNRTTLPPCLTTDRTSLHPERTVGMPGAAEPGITCLRNCRFELCPYPAKGEQPGAELRESFCRQQQALLKSRTFRRRAAPWQGMTRTELDRFWAALAERTRTPKV